MAFQTHLSPTKSFFLPQSFGHPYIISLTLNRSYQLSSIFKRMVKLKNKIVQ